MGQPDPIKRADGKEDSVKGAIDTLQLGVWQVLTFRRSRSGPQQWRLDFVAGMALFYRLVGEIYQVSPWMLSIFVLSKLWNGVETAILMHLTNRLLRMIEVGLIRGEPDANAIYMAVVARLSCVIFVSVLRWWCDRVIPKFKTRVKYHYDVFLMRVRLKTDIPTSQDPSNENRVSSDDAWYAFEGIIQFCAELLNSASQLALIIHMSRSSGGPIFALLSVAKPLLHSMGARNLWSRVCVLNTNNSHYNRMQALSSLSGDKYKQDYIGGNLGDHILKEYERAAEALGATSTEEAWEQSDKRQTPYFDIFSELLGDLPMVYCAMNAIINPSKFSIASIAVLQQSSFSLRYSMQHILYGTKSFARQFSKLKNMYALAEVTNKIRTGNIPYPKLEDKQNHGMGFELRNVTFTYPGSKKTNPALDNVSLTIKPSQLVVIVGENGSGKSTIIKLLSRLYDSTSGELLMDGTPAQDYCAGDLREATAMFTQDHNLFPLSLYENIGLGCPDRLADKDMVAKAAEQGGASEFISKLKDGILTVLDPYMTTYGFNVPSDSDHPLRKKMEELEKKIDVSGGEKQRIVAARTFMQLNSGKVKFVAVDEPSSALDPEGELQLFKRLIASRAGKTMVFVTHRFGHLTKHADLIICMKDGNVAESGNHETLLHAGGEYEKLFRIQADAFANGNDPYEVMSNSG